MSQLLEITDLNVFYGKFQALFNINITFQTGEIVSIIGRNGAGKTTLFRAIMGIEQPKVGKIQYRGEDITQLPPPATFNKGIAYVPGEREIFDRLTVKENITMGLPRGANFCKDEKVFDYFPRLLELLDRKGGNLSGGEQQMLAIARSLVSEPDLILIDELTEGLAPSIINDFSQKVQDIQAGGTHICLIDHNLDFVREIADKVVIIGNGKVKFDGSIEKIENNPTILEEHMAV
jgi:ABC-type branched-subunit amino acid transport system ATPase component